MIFDMNRAWREAGEMVTANREVLLVVAGLFFFLPSLAFALFVPAPQPTAGANPEQMAAMVAQFYQGNLPWLLLISVLQMVGVLTMLALLRDQAKPTVGDALKRGVIGAALYLVAQIAVAFAVVLVGAVLVGTASMTGIVPLIVIAIIAMLVILFYVTIKTSLVPAVLAIERENNPFLAIRRSWLLTKGNSFRIFLFYALLVLVIGIASIVIGGVLGIVLALLGGTAVHIGQAAISGLIGAVATVYFVSIVAAIHRQLAGPSTEAIGNTFE